MPTQFPPADDPRRVLIVLTTLPADHDTAAFARTLIEERLAACVNVLPPVQSVYRWRGAIEQDTERLVLIKTTRERFPALEVRVASLHPYETPELLVVDTTGGASRYLEWVVESTAPDDI